MAKRRSHVRKKTAAPAKKAATARPARVGKKRTVSVKDPAGSKRRRLVVDLPPNATLADRLEAEHFVRVLDDTEQLAREPGPIPPGATHRIETDRAGAKRVVRKRFSAR